MDNNKKKIIRALIHFVVRMNIYSENFFTTILF